MKNTKRIKAEKLIGMLLVVVMLAGFVPAGLFGVEVSAIEGGGTGLADPYLINNYDDLRAVMKTFAYHSTEDSTSYTYIKLTADIIVQDDKDDYYIETFGSADHYLLLDLNGHTLIRRTTSTKDAFMFNVRCHLLIADKKGGGIIRFKTACNTADTAVFFSKTLGSWLEIFDGSTVVNETGGTSYMNCGLLAREEIASTSNDVWMSAGDCRIVAELPMCMIGNVRGDVNGAALCSTASSSRVAVKYSGLQNTNQIKMFNFFSGTAYGNIEIKTHNYSMQNVFGSAKIYKDSYTEWDHSSIAGSCDAVITGSNIVVANKSDPYISTVAVNGVKEPYAGMSVSEYPYNVSGDHIIVLGISAILEGGRLLSGSYKFVSGKSYIFKIHVMPAGGYMFRKNAEDNSATLNGSPAEVIKAPCWYTSSTSDIYIRFQFTAKDGPVTKFEATVTAPSDGKHPSFTVVPGNSQKYDAVITKWVKDLDEKGNYRLTMTEDSVFETGYRYRVYVKFTLKDGNTTEGKIYDTPAIINGESAGSVAPMNQTEYGLYVLTFELGEILTKYSLKVTSGKATSGSDTGITSSPAGKIITLTADAALGGRLFDKWEIVSGDVTLANAYSSTTSFTMPAGAVELKATYKDAPAVSGLTATITAPTPNALPATTAVAGASTYTVFVDAWFKGGTAGSPGERMTDGERFEAGYTYVVKIGFTPASGYSIASDTPALINGYETKLTGHNVATGTKYYRLAFDLSGAYSVTVTNGKATADKGTVISKADAGSTVTITADDAPAGKEFDKWVVVSGGVTLADAGSAKTAFTMPSGAVEIKAVYKDKAVALIKVTSAVLGLNGYSLGSDSKKLTVSSSTAGVTVNWWILCIDNDNDGAPDDYVSGNIEGGVSYILGVTVSAGSGYDISGLTKGSVKLGDGTVASDFAAVGGGNYNIYFKLTPFADTSKEYSITVVGGKAYSGSGVLITKALAGKTVKLQAEIPADKEFAGWTVISGGVVLADANSAGTYFTMPDEDVKLEAKFRDSVLPTVKISSAVFSISGYAAGENATGITVTSGTAGITVEGNYGENFGYCLGADSNGDGNPDETFMAVLAADTDYWLNLVFRIDSGYDISALSADSITLSDGTKAMEIEKTDIGYAIVLFRLPRLGATHTHSAVGDWQTDSNSHRKVCSCGATLEEAAHTYVDRNVCTVCGYKRPDVEIPATGTDTEPTPAPAGGNGNMIFLLALILVSIAGVTGVVIYIIKKKRITK